MTAKTDHQTKGQQSETDTDANMDANMDVERLDVQQQPILQQLQTESTTTAKQSEQSQLIGIFFVENRRRKQDIKIVVKLCADGIYLRRETTNSNHINEQLIRIEDIVGSSYGQRVKKRARGGLNSCKSASREPSENEPQNDQLEPEQAKGQADNSAYLYIYAYLKKEKPFRRVQTLRILRFRTSDDYAENLNTARLWHRRIREHKQRSVTTPDGVIVGQGAGGKKLLILLNPKSGSGKGRELFQKQVAPLLSEAETQYDLQITTHPQYAQEFVRTRKDLLERYDGIVVASGDGLFYEVLNGLMERMDWRRACRELSLGIIPCGSGNGLAKSIAHHCNEPYEPKPILHATLICVAGRTTPMDVVRVELNHRDKHFVMYSFLSIGWGLIADIDIESERLRSIGAQRFTLWAIRRLITLRCYPGKLYYLPAKSSKTNHTDTTAAARVARAPQTDRSSPEPPPVEQSNHRLAPRRSTAHEKSEFRDLPDDDDNDVQLRDYCHSQFDEYVDALSTDRCSYRQNADSWHSAVSRRTAYFSLGGHSTRSNRSRLSVAQRIESANAEFNQLVPTATMPGLLLPLPAEQGWLSEEGEFVMVHAAYTTHLASDCFFAPDSRLNDGLIYLVIIRSGVGRSQLLNFLLSMQRGSHLPAEQDPYIQVMPVRAFRIEPSGSNGILTIDGERVDYGPIQAEVFPGLINVMTSTGQ
ncbi:sphingosine kinase 2 isoform X2 [Drosophila grimshawi]|uniref:sphingosine kinase n=2 Tax=Drosophila grimshawi TaxID=7222 RepID=B4JIX0_DROGR|nr:sphingosine kinase 2 isoform X2 [Drosophila grimshawi]EDV99534.1 GH12403 [Drosophila grimshawi]